MVRLARTRESAPLLEPQLSGARIPPLRPHREPTDAHLAHDRGLDAILAWQLTVACAGESRETTKRLGWWNTDLVDATGGGDIMARLPPRTHEWA
jgi:hypothetical protein